ncbi:protein PTHB1 isoform X11 [Anser cygnoides]|uniref:protein PTHB1 isoform X11 n=1 Tax=Anser cygnoides TaxID=8845 RepID=UPI0034D37708
MSLFKARDWWSTTLGEKEEFDQGCLCVADVDNSGQDKIIVGSYMGYLRIFHPHPVKPGDDVQAEDLLLEVQLQEPILQVEVGKFVSGTEGLHLAVLHCRKLCVYAVSGTQGNVEHGNQYQIKLMYEHNLQRTACNMTYGPFGGVKGRDLICIQSMDGMLMLFEQESYAFGRFLPGFLLPGPLTYSSRTDSFITVSSCQQVESYKYQVLVFATDAEARQETVQQKLSSGKRLVVDWVLNIGEQALDICIVSFNQAVSSVFVLGERNLFCLKDNGQLRFMKKLDYSPSCFIPYCSVKEGTINTLVGNHSNVLNIYQDVTLKWAAQLPHVPVSVKVANIQNLKGVIVTLSENGHLQCSYLGTDPSFFQAPRVDSKEVNYEEFNAEMKELQKIIREAMKTQDILPQSEKRRDLIVTAEVSPDLDAESKAIDSEVKAEVVPSVTVKVTVQSRVTAQKPNLSVCVQAPLAVTCDQFIFNDLEPDSSETVVLSVFLKGNCPPSELEGNCVVSCSTPTELNPEGIPKVAQCKFKLPLRLICFPAQPSKSANHKITIDTNKPPISFLTIFPDFADPSEDDQANVLGFQFLTGSKITLLASKTSQRYRIQSDQLEDLWLITKELTLRLEEHFKKQNCKDFACTFSGSIPLQEYFELIDRHFELRLNAEKFRELLSERAVQFRAIERRLLTRFKDKTPAPLQHLDTLLEGTFREGWEETVDSAISSLLRTCLSKSSKEQALTLGGQLSMPKDTSRLKKNISLFCDRLAKGGRLSLSTESATQQVTVVPGGCSTIPESDLEERVVVLGSTATFTNHKHAAKQKSKPDIYSTSHPALPVCLRSLKGRPC